MEHTGTPAVRILHVSIILIQIWNWLQKYFHQHSVQPFRVNLGKNDSQLTIIDHLANIFVELLQIIFGIKC